MKPTIYFGDATIDGETFFQLSMRSAAALAAAGIGAGDFVGLMLRNEPGTLALMLAARWLGARWVPVNWHFKAEEARTILGASGIKVLVAHTDLMEAIRPTIPEGVRVFSVEPQHYTCRLADLDEVPASAPGESWADWRDEVKRPPVAESPRPGSPMFFTSGATGPAKGVLWQPPTPQQQQALMANTCEAYGLAPGARVLACAPMYHSGPNVYTLVAAMLGCEIVLEPRFDAETVLRRIEQRRLSHLYLVPTMYVRLLRLPAETAAKYDLSSVQFVASTGSMCSPELKRQMIEWWGPVIHETYGCSEMSLMTHIDSAESLRKPGSAGRPLPGVTIRVLDDEGRSCAPGVVGTVYVRAETIPAFTYLGDPQARQAAERGGAVTIGDVGYLDDEGFLFLVDRRADMVNSGGTKIHTPEIEAVLMQMPGVADCAVYGVSDEEFGQALMAAVQLLPGATPSAEQVRDFVRQRLAGFKVPRHVEFHDRLPREDTGKLFKRRLREAQSASTA